MYNIDSYGFEKIDNEYFYDGSLGAIYTTQNTIFRVWSPMATNVMLNIYNKCTDTKAQHIFKMEKKEKRCMGVHSRWGFKKQILYLQRM